MALVDEFLKRHFVDNHRCDECNRHFPMHALITLDSPFTELNGKYCTVCYHKIYDLIGYCDECGNEMPKKYLYKSLFDKSVVCKECLQHEAHE